ncbi:MAG: hypothetical protein IPK31_00655 [Chitinophagaceae bacterium]|nr:hypothetical protein [Chitinophagaceae bacterium]
MKHLLLFVWLFIIATTLGSGCKKNKLSELDKLPPETQTGANTFGCLINGQTFIPGGLQLSGGSLNCVYQYIYNGTSDGYFFGLNAGRKGNNCEVKSVGIRLDSMIVQEGFSYPLTLEKRGNGNGQYFIINVPCGTQNTGYYTNSSIQGSIHFKRFDLNNQIASGTFWFNAVNSNNDTIKITEGRFDVKFTR